MLSSLYQIAKQRCGLKRNCTLLLNKGKNGDNFIAVAFKKAWGCDKNNWHWVKAQQDFCCWGQCSQVGFSAQVQAREEETCGRCTWAGKSHGMGFLSERM